MQWHYFLQDDPVVAELARLLDDLGPRALISEWRLDRVEAAGDPQAAQDLQRVSDSGDWVSGEAIAEIARRKPQVIEGELSARVPGESQAWIMVRAVDGMYWDVKTNDANVLERIAATRRRARELE